MAINGYMDITFLDITKAKTKGGQRQSSLKWMFAG